MSKSSEEVNGVTGRDVAYATSKGLFGMIPIVGAVASELFGAIVTPPLEKRRKEWMQDIGERLQALEAEGKIDLESLSTNEQFIDVVLQATSLALKTSQKEKIQAFKNIIANTAKGEAPDETKSQIFLSLVDAYTPWHFRILSLLDSPREWFAVNKKKVPNVVSGSVFRLINEGFADLRGQEELTEVIVRDMYNAGLHTVYTLRDSRTLDFLMNATTTQLGKDFIRFISLHD